MCLEAANAKKAADEKAVKLAAEAQQKAEEAAAAAALKKAEEGMWTVHDDVFHYSCHLISGDMFCVFRSCYCRKESGGGSCCRKEEGRGRYVDRA